MFKKIVLLFAIVLPIILILGNSYSHAEGTIMQVAGTIRNSGKGWYIIRDSTHDSIGITNVITAESTINVEHKNGFTKVISFTVTTDETMTQEGYKVGVSSTPDVSKIFICDKYNNLVKPKDCISELGNIWIYAMFEK